MSRRRRRHDGGAADASTWDSEELSLADVHGDESIGESAMRLPGWTPCLLLVGGRDGRADWSGRDHRLLDRRIEVCALGRAVACGGVVVVAGLL
jgi:hypothetical protein